MRGVGIFILLATATVLAMSVMAAGPASDASAACRRVRPGEASMWERTMGVFFTSCLELKTGTGEYAEVEGSGAAVAGEPGVLCYRVKAGEPSSWKDSQCTVAENSTNGFVKVGMGEWLVDEASTASALAADIEWSLQFTDLKAPILGEATAECSGIFDGSIGPEDKGEITEVLNLSGESIGTLGGLGLECVNIKNCSNPLVWPDNLPWSTETVLMIGTPEFLDYLFGAGAGKEPGWEVQCMGVIGEPVDLCESAVSGALENLTGETPKSVEIHFSLTEQEANKEELGECTAGGKEAGHIQGEGLILLTGGEAGLNLGVS